YGVGYFIYVDVAVNVEIANNSRYVKGTQQFNLVSGWNMIGRVGCNATTASALGNAIKAQAGVTDVAIAKWNSTEGNWDGYLVGISPSNRDFDIGFGGGYFVFVNTAVSIEL
ncbi:MAG: hypothetical protein AB1485_10000, partial [Candidatus Thermoplasmatota archaeon]